jgi:hypothetical protein
VCISIALQVSGELTNIGQAAICDLRLSNAFAAEGQSVYSSWPEWVAADRWEQHFVPGQSIKTGKCLYFTHAKLRLPFGYAVAPGSRGCT